MHQNDYTNLPWSRTPLKFFFHRSVPTEGNTNTPNVSKINYVSNRDNTVFSSTHAANYKMIVTMN